MVNYLATSPWYGCGSEKWSYGGEERSLNRAGCAGEWHMKQSRGEQDPFFKGQEGTELHAESVNPKEAGKLVANISTLLNSNAHGIGERPAGTRPVDAKAIQDLALQLGAHQPDVQWEHIEVSIRYWRCHTDLADRLNWPHCKVADTNDHCSHYCVEPAVVAARKDYLELLAAAIPTCKLTPTTARSLTAMYTIDNEWGHIDTGAAGGETCADLVEGLLVDILTVEAAHGALTALLEPRPSERIQGWFTK